MITIPHAIERAAGEVAQQTAHAILKYPLFSSVHEAMGVLQNEMYELTMAIHKKDRDNIREELAQVAAVATKALASLSIDESIDAEKAE